MPWGTRNGSGHCRDGVGVATKRDGRADSRNDVTVDREGDSYGSRDGLACRWGRPELLG